MITRDSNFYDIMALGLADAANLQEFVDTMFADKYNAPQTDGFLWDDNIQLDFSYEQLEAELGVYAMATFVDISSPGGTHSVQGATISTGKIPRFKHGFIMDEKTIREQMILAQRFGSVTPQMQSQLSKIMFNSIDKLIGGNYNTLTYQRHQAVSTGAFALTSTNNPGGIQNLTFDFGIPATNRNHCGGFGSRGTANAWSSSSANPIGDLQDMVQYADDNMMPYGHFEMSKSLWNTFKGHENVKKQVALYVNMNADVANVANFLVTESMIGSFLIEAGLPPIKVIDSLVLADKYDAATRKMVYTQIRPFDELKVCLVPDGQLGTIKAVEPIALADPGARIAYYDGGRTVLKQTFDTKNTIQYIESELTALVVPSVSRYILILNANAGS